jgi:hypothetical protein
LKQYWTYYLVLFLVITPFFLAAQEDTISTSEVDTTMGDLEIVPIEEIPSRPGSLYLFSPRASFTVPNPMGNSAFKKTFVGIYEANIGFNLMIFKGLYAGVAFKNGLLKVTQKTIPNYNAGMHMYNAAVKVGGDFYLNEKNTILVSAAMSAGQNVTKFSSLVSKTPGKQPDITGFKALYAEPELNIYLFTEANFGFGFTLSYTVLQRTFNPYELSLNDWTSYNKTNTGNTQYLSFGFGMYYGIVHKSSQNN